MTHEAIPGKDFSAPTDLLSAQGSTVKHPRLQVEDSSPIKFSSKLTKRKLNMLNGRNPDPQQLIDGQGSSSANLENKIHMTVKNMSAGTFQS